MTQLNVSTVDWAIVRCSFEFGGMTIQNDSLLNWGFFGFILAVSDDFDIHFQTVCLPLTLHSMRLALSLLGFSSLAAANENLDGKWSSTTQISDDNNKLLISNLQFTTLSGNQPNPYVCVMHVSSLCTKFSRTSVTYLFGITGCAMPKAERTCSDSCTSSSYLVQIGDPIDTVEHVNPNDILPNKCDYQAQLVQSTQYWMYLLLWGSLMRNVMSVRLTNCQYSNFLLFPVIIVAGRVGGST